MTREKFLHFIFFLLYRAKSLWKTNFYVDLIYSYENQYKGDIKSKSIYTNKIYTEESKPKSKSTYETYRSWLLIFDIYMHEYFQVIIMFILLLIMSTGCNLVYKLSAFNITEDSDEYGFDHRSVYHPYVNFPNYQRRYPILQSGGEWISWK